MKLLLTLSLILFLFNAPRAQTYLTRTAHINIKSANKVQDIVANNYQVACQLNAQTGEFKIIALIKSFEYQIGAMNRVMNTLDINVTEYPRITYDGKIANLKQVNFLKSGNYPLKIDGILYIWDEKRVTSADGTLTVNSDGTLEGNSNFTITIEDKNLKKIDTIMKQKLPGAVNLQPNVLGISKDIQVKATAILKKQ
ncbi:MAG: hypothetical protein JW798_12430 [Prolixibacteraceae bacterium]|nr:hypothetical protein [Prolixibacteraceae bacterium]